MLKQLTFMYMTANMNKDNVAAVQLEKINILKKALKGAGLDFVIHKRNGNVAIVNIWIGENK